MSAGHLHHVDLKELRWAGQILNAPVGVIEKELRHYKDPESTRSFRVPLDDGAYEFFHITVVRHRNPYEDSNPDKGGTRVHHDIRVIAPRILRRLGYGMTTKWALFNLPFGGAKSGIWTPRPLWTFSSREVYRIFQGATETLVNAHLIGPHTYVLATDIGTNAEHMDIIHREYLHLVGSTRGEGAAVTGRTEYHNGFAFRRESTGFGGHVILDYIRKERPTFFAYPLPDEPTAVVQGIGEVGGAYVRFAKNFGIRIIGFSNAHEKYHAVYNQDGFNTNDLPDDPNGSLKNVPGEQCSHEELLGKPCDLLVLAAMEDTLTETLAKKIQPRCGIQELANHPITYDAERILLQRGIPIIPDQLSNGGGGIVSYIEWELDTGKLRHYHESSELSETIAKPKLIRIMNGAAENVFDLLDFYGKTNGEKLTLRRACLLKSVKTLSDALVDKHGGNYDLYR